jgi:hypothetical protein
MENLVDNGRTFGRGAERLDACRHDVTQAVLDLFAAHGIEFNQESLGCDNEPALQTELSFLGLAGFSGPFFSGYIVLKAGEHLLRHSNQTTSDPADWMGELANQLLGRIKNRMLREGIALMRLPTAVAMGLGASLLGEGECPPLITLNNGHGSVMVWMKTEPSCDLGECTVVEPDNGVMAEGEMVLF